MDTTYVPRCGDTVKHRPTGETWEVAFADPKTDTLAWFGWPPDGLARLSDCEIEVRCTDEDHERRVAVWLDEPHRDSQTGREDPRVRMIRHLYRPMEERRMLLERAQREAADLAASLSGQDQELLDLLVAFGSGPIEPCAHCGTPLVNRGKGDGRRGLHDCPCGKIVCDVCVETQDHMMDGRHGAPKDTHG